MSSGAERYRDTLLIELFAKQLRFDRLADRLLGSRSYGPHLLLAAMLAASYAVRAPLLVAEPWRVITSAAIVGGLVLGLLGALYMRDGYADAVRRLRLDERPRDHDEGQFETIVSTRLQGGIYAVAIVVTYGNVFFGTGIDMLVSEAGLWPIVLRLFVAAPLAYIPIVIDVGTTFLGIHFLLPRRLRRADLDLFFYDPRNMGGFAPIGELLKRSYYVYTGGLLAYFAFVYIPIIFSGVIESSYEANVVIAIFFSLAWFAGVASIGYSMWTVHSLMAERKEQRLRELEDDLRDVIENPYDIRSSTVADEGKLSEITRQLEQVRGMREYPTTFTMWSQILISAVVPQALNVAVQAAG